MEISKWKLIKLLWKIYGVYNQIKEVGMDFFKSKKSWVAITSILSTILVNFIGLPPELVGKIIEAIMAIASAYLIGQGVADAGKEKAKVEKNN